MTSKKVSKKVINQPHKNTKYLFLAQEGKCFYCGVSIEPHSRHGKGHTVDHFYPSSRISKGRERNGWNIVLACRECNESKGNRSPTSEEYRRKRRVKADAKWLREQHIKGTITINARSYRL